MFIKETSGSTPVNTRGWEQKGQRERLELRRVPSDCSSRAHSVLQGQDGHPAVLSIHQPLVWASLGCQFTDFRQGGSAARAAHPSSCRGARGCILVHHSSQYRLAPLVTTGSGLKQFLLNVFHFGKMQSTVLRCSEECPDHHVTVN